jgi:hypothetical protein
MPAQPSPSSTPELGIQARLHGVAQLLRESRHLDPKVQLALAELLEEFGKAFDATTAPPEEVIHLADDTAHLIEALHQGKDTGLVTSARNRLQRAVIEADAHAPFLVGIARKLLDALVSLGI